MATLQAMAGWMRKHLGDFPPESNGVWKPGDGREIGQLGVALEGRPEIATRAAAYGCDALLLHRPWGIGAVPASLGVLAAHEALDDRLTLAENPWLLARLGFRVQERLEERRGWPLAVVAQSANPIPAAEFWDRLGAEFPGWTVGPGTAPPQSVERIALANAMRPSLVEQAAIHGARLYVTGTLRPSALDALGRTSLTVVLLGHHPPERWGLRWLAHSLSAHYDLSVVWLDSTDENDTDATG